MRETPRPVEQLPTDLPNSPRHFNGLDCIASERCARPSFAPRLPRCGHGLPAIFVFHGRAMCFAHVVQDDGAALAFVPNPLSHRDGAANVEKLRHLLCQPLDLGRREQLRAFYRLFVLAHLLLASLDINAVRAEDIF
jgi:hypothetical protein